MGRGAWERRASGSAQLKKGITIEKLEANKEVEARLEMFSWRKEC